jgi:hypothetical protein
MEMYAIELSGEVPHHSSEKKIRRWMRLLFVDEEDPNSIIYVRIRLHQRFYMQSVLYIVCTCVLYSLMITGNDD